MNIETFKELGLAGISIGALAYICFKLVVELGENRKDYCSYVNENNHTTTELVKEATVTMTSVRDSIDVNTKTIEKLLDKLER
jgi:hypothetical protein